MSDNCSINGCNNSIYCKGFCRFHYNQDYYARNRSSILTQKKHYSSNNKNNKKEYDQVYRLKNKDKIVNDKRKYYDLNIDRIKEYDKKYRQDNKIILNEKRKSYYNGRMKNDPVFRLRKISSTLIRMYLKKSGGSKNNISIMKYLPYSFQELKDHLEKLFEPWMNWGNQGIYNSDTWKDDDSSTWTWQIDHIVPQSKLPFASMEDDNFQKCWALSNLRPLSSKQNLLEGARER